MEQEVLLGKEISQKPRLGFLGLGWIGRNRMEAIIHEDCAIVSHIAEPLEDNAKLALQSACNAVFVHNLDDLVSNSDLDGIVIATPSALHSVQAIKALQHGKAVFCQKPLGRTAEEVRAVVETAQNVNKLLGVDLSYRYTQGVQAIYPLVREGKLGEIFAVDLTFHNAYGPDKPWFYDLKKSGGGCVMDLGIHLVDLALWCLSFPVIESVNSSLYHKGKKIRANEEIVEDFATATLQTTQGVTINLQCSWNLSAGRDAVISASFYGTQGGCAFFNVNGSFYDFMAEKYEGTRKTVLATPPDNWGGRAGVAWAKKLSQNPGFDQKESKEFIQTAEILDMIYGR